MKHVLSDRCRQFFEHWDSLRAGKVMPSLQEYLAQPSPDLQPHVMIFDIVSRTEIPIRLFGTALVDLTKSDVTKRDFMHTFAPPGMADRYAEVAQILVQKPCGTNNIKIAQTSKGQHVELDCITLPLEPYPDGPPCLVMFTHCTTELDPGDFVYQVVGYGAATWIDLGAGTPGESIEATSKTEEIDLQSKDDLFKTFEEHWRFLRGEQSAPTVSEFLNRPIPLLQPHLTMLDIDSEQSLSFRLIGTGMAESIGMDATGQNILDFAAPDLRQSFYDIVSKMIQHPCGAEVHSIVTSTTGRPYKFHSMGFPLRRKQSNADCIVWFNKPIEGDPTRQAATQMFGMELLRWIDIGAGTPSA